jgi:predicted Zn-dependent peptidase
MDLFLVGDFETSQVRGLAAQHFAPYPFAQGPVLDLPRAEITRGYNALSATSSDLRGPLSELKIAWSTGVRITDPDAKVMLALGGCLNGALFEQIRDRLGDAYTPEAVYDCDRTCGIFEILVTSSKSPAAVESRVFETIATLKRGVDPHELDRFRDRFELMRHRKAESNDTLLENMVNKALNGATICEFDVGSITPADVLAAARRYLPSHKGAYVRLALTGQ